MLNHLFATILICLGVANTTPISNYKQKESNLVLTTPKKQTITNNYTISLTETGEVRQTFENVNVGYYKNGKDTERKWNFSYTSNYLQITGNKYRTTSYVSLYRDDPIPAQWNDMTLFQNWETIQNNTNNISDYSKKDLYVLKITPYNYNINTETSVLMRMNIQQEWTDDYGETIRIDNRYIIRNVYQSNDTNWDNYIGRQIVRNTASTIVNDIENINNGFYYDKRQEIINVNTDSVITDEWEQPIGNETNYIIVEYIYCVKAQVNTGTWQDFGTEYGVVPTAENEVYTSYMTISGTNVIPDGTYEVVDIPGLMFEVIGMPFAFVSQAFNLTLFPGTPYQVNIANLFLSIAAIFVFVWLLLLFIKMKG